MSLITPQAVFEELRFIWELLAAEYLFLLPFAQRREGWLPRTLAGAAALTLLSMGFFPWRLFWEAHLAAPNYMIGTWYILFSLVSICFPLLCFEITVCDMLYIGIASYAAQHIVYVVIHEALALAAWPGLPLHLGLYALISLAFCALLYRLIYLVFARRLSLCGGRLLEDTPVHIVCYVLFLAVLIFCTLACQHLFHFAVPIQMTSAALGGLICVMILCIQYFSFRMILAGREQAVISQMLRDGERHYSHSKELIERINQNAHDLKHTINALKILDEADRSAFLQEMEGNLRQYEHLVFSDNEALNTLLVEKSLLCESLHIRFSCAIDPVELDFLSVPDLYTLLGNAIDNAIEGVRPLADAERRVVQLRMQRQQRFLLIQTNNYFEGQVSLEGSLPRTTKADKFSHGYGLKSIRYLAQKYGGSMCVQAKDQVFVLQITLPLPA